MLTYQQRKKKKRVYRSKTNKITKLPFQNKYKNYIIEVASDEPTNLPKKRLIIEKPNVNNKLPRKKVRTYHPKNS